MRYPRALLLAFLTAVGLALVGGHAAPVRAAGPCPSSADAALDAEESAFVQALNGYRSQNGLGALTVSPVLSRAAAWMAADMATHNAFGHTDSLGRSSEGRAVDCGYPANATGENIAGGGALTGAQQALDAWKASPPHNQNMLYGAYRVVGVGRAYAAGSTYGWYWVADFGLVGDQPSAAPTPAPSGGGVANEASQQPQPQPPATAATAAAASTAAATSEPSLPQLIAVPAGVLLLPRTANDPGPDNGPAPVPPAPSTAPNLSAPEAAGPPAGDAAATSASSEAAGASGAGGGNAWWIMTAGGALLLAAAGRLVLRTVRRRVASRQLPPRLWALPGQPGAPLSLPAARMKKQSERKGGGSRAA
jgi:uncharacterized protein YkwD